MNIAFIGIGGVGGYFGGKMSQILNDSELDISLYYIARGQHLTKIRENGLILKTNDCGEFTCIPTLATDDFNELPILDVCFLCVKQYDLEEALKNLSDKISENTQIIPLLNGVDIYHRIRKVLKKGIVFPSCVYVGTHIEAPGIVSQNGGSCTIIFGKDPENPEVNPEKICEIMKKTNIKYEWTINNVEEIWSKYMFIAAYGLVTASENKTLGQILEDKKASEKVINIMNEIYSISKAEKVDLPEDIVEKSYEKAKNFSYGTKTSFQRDYEIKGKPNEKELFGQAIINLGKKHNIDTVTTEMVYKQLV